MISFKRQGNTPSRELGRAPADVLRVVLAYAVFASLWILLSDTVVGWLFSDPARIVRVSTIKGWLFVVVTSLLLYGLIRHLRDQALAASRQELAAQAEKLRALQLLAAIADNSSDAIFAKDREGRYLMVNLEVERVVGRTPAQMLGQDDTVLFPQQAETLRANDRRVMDENRTNTYEETLATAEGERTFLATKGPLHDEQGQVTGLFGISRDITERKHAELALTRLGRLYATLSQSNQAIVRCDSEDALFPQICRDAVSFGGLKMAWIGLVDESGHHAKPFAAFGDDDNYLADIHISMDAGDPHGQGPTATAIRENRPVWCQDFLHDPRTAPWHERGARAGWMASASLPLQRRGVIDGALTLYAGEAGFFDDAIQKLLIQMAADISFAMDSYAATAERKRAEVKMAQQLDELRRWQQAMLGREGRIMEMKKEVNALLAERGQPPRYVSAVDEGQKT